MTTATTAAGLVDHQGLESGRARTPRSLAASPAAKAST
jgi:hypothetical protein